MQTDGTLLVPDVPTVPYITGDGVGAEVTPAQYIKIHYAERYRIFILTKLSNFH